MIELKPLQGQVKDLVEDLRGQVAALDELRSSLTEEYAEARRAGADGGTFETLAGGRARPGGGGLGAGLRVRAVLRGQRAGRDSCGSAARRRSRRWNGRCRTGRHI